MFEGGEEQVGSNNGYLSLWPHQDQPRRIKASDKDGSEVVRRDHDSVLQSSSYGGGSSTTSKKRNVKGHLISIRHRAFRTQKA